MTLNPGLFSSKRQTWRTPVKLYEALDRVFHFDHDPCPVDPQEDGLVTEWGERNFVNPPFGREIGLWVRKGYDEALKGRLVVMLLPARTDTSYWHSYVMRATKIHFLPGRLHFDDGPNPAPFPSAIVVFEPGKLGGPPTIESGFPDDNQG